MLDCLRSRSRTFRLPAVTIVATGIAAIAAIAQFAVPGLDDALGRLPGGALPPEQSWRAVTPLLVQTLGWYQVVANLISLIAIGAVAEQFLSRSQWLGAFVAGTVGGQLAAYGWHETGGGDSIAVCGLAGGTAVAVLPGGRVSRLSSVVIIGYVVALTGWSLGGARLAVTAVALLTVTVGAALIFGRRVLDGLSAHLLLGVLACAAVLCTAGDLHGVSLLSGLAFVAVLEAVGIRGRDALAQPGLPPGPHHPATVGR